MKKIAFLVPKVHNQGGVARVSAIISNAISKKNSKYEIIIIGYTSGNMKGYDWNSEFKYYTVFQHDTSLTKGLVKGTLFVRQIIHNEGVNLLVVCDSNLALLGITSTLFKKTKLIYWDHTNFFETTSHKFKKESKIAMSYFADSIVVLTKQDQKNWNKYTKARSIYQIYNPVEIAKRNKKEYNINSIKIISVGRLTRQKNFKIIPKIAKQLQQLKVNFFWDIYGEGDLREEIENAITYYNVGDNVCLKGHQEMNEDVYSQYSVMAMTSNYEGFPMVLLEGLSNKLPLVSFDIKTGPNEIIENGKNGFLIDSFDVEDFANKIKCLFEDDELRCQLSLNTKSKLENFNKKNIINDWLKLIDKVLEA